MKIRIIDLMDQYHDDSVKLSSPEDLERRTEGKTPTAAVPAFRHGKRPLLVAAALLLVLTAGVITPFMLSRSQGGGAMTEGASPDATPDVEAFGGSAAEQTENTVGTPSDLVSPQVLEGTWNYEENIYANGNLFYFQDSYYTMTENGPEAIEMQNLHTTVDFHGSWEVDIDYAVVDGELIFRNNTDRNSYTVVNGEKMRRSEYEAYMWEQMGVSEDTPWEERPEVDLSAVEWVTPQVAIAEPLQGSADTVELSIRRNDIAYIDNGSYPFFYNIFTGEITDPLSNVPELFDHGSFGPVTFNNALTRAMVWTEGELKYGNNSTGFRTYLCDLNTGEMTWVVDLLKPFLPEEDEFEQYDPDVGLKGSLWSEGSGFYWADNDTLLFFLNESIKLPDGTTVTDELGFSDEWERHSWLFAYNVADGSLRYQSECSGMGSFVNNENLDYLHYEAYHQDDDSVTLYTIDTATGAVYTTGDQHFPLNYSAQDITDTKQLYYYSSGELYLIDDAQLGWIDLSPYIQFPEGEITSVELLGNNGLALATAEGLYCYTIPDGLPMTPMTEK